MTVAIFAIFQLVSKKIKGPADSRTIQGGPKKLAQCFYMLITSSNINRFSKYFHCWNQEKIYGNTIAIGPTTP